MATNLNQESGISGATAQSLNVPQSEESVLGGRTETYGFGVQEFGEEGDTSPTYRLVIDVSGGNSVGRLQFGYYVRVNDSVYFVTKKAITVAKAIEAEKVFAFLAKTKLPFTVSIRHSETLSGYQYVEGEVSDDTAFYTVREFKVFRSLWRVIEGELYQDLYSPHMARFTDGSLDWYVKLMPEGSLKFKQVSSISLNYVTSQGHLEVFKISSTEPLPGYLYNARKKLVFFNHSIEGNTFDVIPLGLERRVLSLGGETTIVSADHEPIVLPMGQYILYHPRPSRDRVD